MTVEGDKCHFGRVCILLDKESYYSVAYVVVVCCNVAYCWLESIQFLVL